MKVAVASGKGGTGKTTLSIAFALSSSNPLTLLDCDVEEPNCSLFLKTCLTGTEKVYILSRDMLNYSCLGSNGRV